MATSRRPDDSVLVKSEPHAPHVPGNAAANLQDDGDCPGDIDGDGDVSSTPCGKSAGRPRAADVQARLQNLLDTAGNLFLENGYSNVSLETIARQAHVAVRTIYVKFGGKAGLLKAIITAKRARYFAPVSEMRLDRRPLRDILADFGLHFLELVNTPASVQLHRMVIAESMSNPELAQTFYDAGPQMTRKILIEFFSLPHIGVQFRPELALDTLATQMINCMLGDQLCRFLIPNDHQFSTDELKEKVEQGLDLFLRSTLR